MALDVGMLDIFCMAWHPTENLKKPKKLSYIDLFCGSALDNLQVDT